MMRARSLALVVGLVALAQPAIGQTTSAPAITRAQQRAATGDSAGARTILDSLQTANSDDPATNAETAYWRGRFAASPTERTQIFTALIVDYPFSPRVGSVLFDLGMSELARGDRDRAASHLSRFLTVSPLDSNHTAASLALGRLLFDRGEGPRACAVLLSGRAQVPPTAIETRNQFDFAVSTCHGVDTSVVLPPPDTAKSVIGEYTVQVAAYDLKTQADKLATRLRGQGLEARVIGKTKPYRVRVGHFVTRPEAEAEAKRIGILLNNKPFVVLVGTEEM